MLIPLILLSIGAIGAGVFFADSFVGDGRFTFWANAIATTPGDVLDEAHHVHGIAKWAPTVMMGAGLLLAILFYWKKSDLPQKTAEMWDGLYAFLLNKWYFDELYNFAIIRPCFWLGRMFWKRGR